MTAVRERTLLRAAWIAPIDQPPIRDGAVVFEGDSIVSVGPAAGVRAAHPDATVKDLGDVAVLPGLVNAHVHLELTRARRPDFNGDFVDWLLAVIDHQMAHDVSVFSAEGARAGVAQCLRFGVSSVGDISREVGVTRPLLQDGPLRTVSYGEVQAMARRRKFLLDRLAMASSTTHASRHLRIGVSPHAPYSIEPDGYRACLQVAQQHDLPMATHLAENEEETVFLSHHEGSFRRLWDKIGAWDDRVPAFDGGPIRFAKAIGLLDQPTLLAHVNHCDDDELALLAATGRASVVYCPRTHAYFRHPPHRWRDMLAAGVNVAVGTDSCASSPDLNLVDDLRLLHAIAPDVSPAELWAMATIRAARAIGQDQSVGTISPGKFADLAIFPVAGADDPLAAILESDALPSQTWIGGVLVRGN